MRMSESERLDAHNEMKANSNIYLKEVEFVVRFDGVRERTIQYVSMFGRFDIEGSDAADDGHDNSKT